MPTDGEAQESELASILAQAEGQDDGSTPMSYAQDGGQAELLTRTSTPKAEPGEQKLLAGKYKSAQELEKGHLNQEKILGQRTSKLKQLESLIQNPKFHAWAAKDPEVRDTLSKLGYELREAESEEDARGEKPWDGNTNSPEYLIAAAEAKNDLRWELFQFGQERGKALSKEEDRAIREVIALAPNLSVSQAWKLTPQFEQSLKAREDKRVADVEKRLQPNRPKPNPTLAPGQTLNLKKHVTEMNDAEKRAYLSKLVEENQ